MNSPIPPKNTKTLEEIEAEILNTSPVNATPSKTQNPWFKSLITPITNGFNHLSLTGKIAVSVFIVILVLALASALIKLFASLLILTLFGGAVYYGYRILTSKTGNP